MFSKRDLEGYLEIDHRESPGLTPVEAAAIPGLPAVAVGRGQRLQAATRRCAHCPRQVVLRPERVRERPYCTRCDSYICDDCALLRKVSGVACRPWQRYLDHWYERAVKGQSNG